MLNRPPFPARLRIRVAAQRMARFLPIQTGSAPAPPRSFGGFGTIAMNALGHHRPAPPDDWHPFDGNPGIADAVLDPPSHVAVVAGLGAPSVQFGIAIILALIPPCADGWAARAAMEPENRDDMIFRSSSQECGVGIRCPPVPFR